MGELGILEDICGYRACSRLKVDRASSKEKPIRLIFQMTVSQDESLPRKHAPHPVCPPITHLTNPLPKSLNPNDSHEARKYPSKTRIQTLVESHLSSHPHSTQNPHQHLNLLTLPIRKKIMNKVDCKSSPSPPPLF